MRSSIGFVLVSALAACGNSGSSHNNTDGSNNGGDGGNTAGLAFDITSTDITLNPGDQFTYCYYFKTPNTTPVAINKWVGDMTAGSHHMIFFAGGPSHADGLDMSGNCGFSIGGGAPAQWEFAMSSTHYELDLPADDGTGKPLAQIIQPGTQGAFQMHYLNAGDSALTVHVELKAYALDVGAPFTQTDAYVTYNQDLAIPPHADAMASPPTTGSIWTATCPVPAGAKFWQGSTHAHMQEVEADVLDGSNMVYMTNDWAHPQVKLWETAPFYSFASGHVTWTCKYVNNGINMNNTLTAANDALHAEMCMMTSYYFPSTGSHFNVQYNGNCISF
jgi:hypothetical protein